MKKKMRLTWPKNGSWFIFFIFSDNNRKGPHLVCAIQIPGVTGKSFLGSLYINFQIKFLISIVFFQTNQLQKI